jgi:NTP pyrophosphatase (non-canonical NTP hydrolase)
MIPRLSPRQLGIFRRTILITFIIHIFGLFVTVWGDNYFRVDNSFHQGKVKSDQHSKLSERFKMKVEGIRIFSLSQLQELNRRLYAVKNDRSCYDPPIMASKMSQHATSILKAVRKGEIKPISYHVSMVFSWSMALANRLHLNMEEEIWKRFPGICTYCNRPTCGCGNKRPKNRKKVPVDPRLRPASCHGYQKMFAVIYPQTLAEAASHLAEEVSEVGKAIDDYIGTHAKACFDHIILELADVFSTLFAVATNAGYDLATEMEKWFKKGCPGCKLSPCDCEYEMKLKS